MEIIRWARFRSGSIPASDVLLQALPRIQARISGIWGGKDAFAVPRIAERRRILTAVQQDLDFRMISGAGRPHLPQPSSEIAARLKKVTSKRFAARVMPFVEYRGAIYPQRARHPRDRGLEPIPPRQESDAVLFTHYVHGVAHRRACGLPNVRPIDSVGSDVNRMKQKASSFRA
jgi:hypothetical protein